MNKENKTPHNFCETSEEKCTMNYCDENGCQNRKRHLVEENKKLREALVKIANSDSSGPDTDGLIEIAKETLKGLGQ